MSFSPTRGTVEKIDENFTHVRANVAMGLFLFKHKGETPAPAELQKPGTSVEIYQGADMLLHLRAAPAKVKLPARKAAPQGVSGTKVNQPAQAVAGLSDGEPVLERPSPVVAAPRKLPARRSS
mgnify:CR=1 FL=1